MIREARIAMLTGAVSFALIVGALLFQYVGHLAPCEMCHWQRWPHIAAALIGLVGVQFLKGRARAVAIIVIALVAASGLIGAYQAGMQWGLLPGPQACTVSHAYVLGSGAPPPVVSCNVVTWSLFGLSMAVYNAIISLGAAVIGMILLTRKA